MTPLKKGDPCRVRLHTGEVVEAVYDHDLGDKDHAVLINGIFAVAFRLAAITPGSNNFFASVRFVGPNCDIQEIKHGTN